jgi:hypothetical protein
MMAGRGEDQHHDRRPVSRVMTPHMIMTILVLSLSRCLVGVLLSMQVAKYVWPFLRDHGALVLPFAAANAMVGQPPCQPISNTLMTPAGFRDSETAPRGACDCRPLRTIRDAGLRIVMCDDEDLIRPVKVPIVMVVMPPSVRVVMMISSHDDAERGRLLLQASGLWYVGLESWLGLELMAGTIAKDKLPVGGGMTVVMLLMVIIGW